MAGAELPLYILWTENRHASHICPIKWGKLRCRNICSVPPSIAHRIRVLLATQRSEWHLRLDIAQGGLGITPTDIAHQRFCTPLIATGPGRKSTAQGVATETPALQAATHDYPKKDSRNAIHMQPLPQVALNHPGFLQAIPPQKTTRSNPIGDSISAKPCLRLRLCTCD